MDNAALLDICLKVTGSFEGGTPSYEAVVGNFDGAGISAGILQWNAGQGTLQKLIQMIGTTMGWAKAQSFFVSSIEEFAHSTPAAGIAFAEAHYLDGKNLAPAAVTAWKKFLATPESIACQQQLAETTTLAHAQKDALLFVPAYAERTRTIAFFFDLINQQGSMSSVHPTAYPTPYAAIAYARTQSSACAALWSEAAASDPLAEALLYYAFERARMSRAQYIWDSLSRRGTIAARKGIVHETQIDFTTLLD